MEKCSKEGILMIDQQLKQKIVNTITRYEAKFEVMNDEMSALRSVMTQMLALAGGIDIDVDKRLSILEIEIAKDKNATTIKEQVDSLVVDISRYKQKKANDRVIIDEFIHQNFDLLSQLFIELKDKASLTKIEQLLNKEADETQLIAEFTKLLGDCVSRLIAKIEYCERHHTQIPADKAHPKTEPLHLVVSQGVNQSLKQLLEHLSIPDELLEKLNTLKLLLQGQITGDSLPRIIDSLTELVVDAFSLEQNQFKVFLSDLTTQLHDFDSYLRFSNESNVQAQKSAFKLETGIQSNIQQIKEHVDTSTSIEDLSCKINQNLEMIGRRLKEFKDAERQRFDDYEEKIKSLQEKLMESEKNSEEIKNMLSFQQAKSNQDSLTGLPNRASYDEHILKAYQRWQRGFGALTLAVADIDYFKTINDNYGHLAGDKVLKKVAALFKGGIRKVDFIARYGGEEFIFIFERTTAESAKELLESLRLAVEACQFSYRENKVDVTVSFGLTAIKADDDIETFFMRADGAMYQAKRAGRNRVESL